MNYEEAAERFARDVRPRARNVLLERRTFLECRVEEVPQGIRAYEGTGAVAVFSVRFHETNVIDWYPLGTVVFRHGGWKTKSTADRMRWASGYHVWRVGEGARGHEDGHLFVKAGTEHPWRDPAGANAAMQIEYGGCIFWNGEYKAGSSVTYGVYVEAKAEAARERQREQRERQRGRLLDSVIHPWDGLQRSTIEAGHLRLVNGVLFSGDHPVAVTYHAPEGGVDAAVIDVSQRALKRTRVGMELVEQAAAAGARLVFCDHNTILTETQNRTGAPA